MIMFNYSKDALLQYNQEGQLTHLLTTQGLSADCLISLMDKAQSFLDKAKNGHTQFELLKNKTVVNLFFEPSTRTRTSFELAARRLGATVVNLDIQTSSTTKGESLRDTVLNLKAMGCDIFIVRHQRDGAAHFVAEQLSDSVTVINAGDGQHAHPSQALLDMLTIRQHKAAFKNLKVAIVGDIVHSRVARSQLFALKTLGVEDIRVIAPPALLPSTIYDFGVTIVDDMETGLADVDVVMMLRLQKERMEHALLPNEQDYFQRYGLTKQRLGYAKADAIVMHPGPINREVEIASQVADGPQSVILEQVSNGVAMRMALLLLSLNKK